jgi:enoyl-CoA hydratase
MPGANAMSEATIRVETEARPAGLIATVTVDNPARLNALNTPLLEALAAALHDLARHDDLRAVVLTGAGDKAFIGGADINEMAALQNGHDARAFITRVHDCCHAIRAVPVPTIARINGYTFGAGLEIAAACDLRLAVSTARFGMPEVRLGIPSVVEAALLPMLVGWGRTRQMLLLGETFSADEAAEWRLVERVVPPADLHHAVSQWLDQVLASPPGAIRRQKQLIRAWEDLPLRAAVAAGIDSFAGAFATDEPSRAMTAFLAAQAARKASG